MRETYRKRGRTVRFEAGHLLRIAEAGEAVEEGGRFECRPLRERPHVAEPPADAVVRLAGLIESLAWHPLSIERLIVSEGIAHHEIGETHWTETIRRVHVALTCGELRALVDLGELHLDDVRRIADALPRAGRRRESPPRVRLAPNVTAALLPALVGIAPIVQSAGGIDGKGQPIHEASEAWPNWYRPSYRVRPVRAPLNLRADCDVSAIDATLPEAIAILAPVTGPVLEVLMVDGNEVYPTTVRVETIEAVGTKLTWFPYGAGSFGANAVVS